MSSRGHVKTRPNPNNILFAIGFDRLPFISPEYQAFPLRGRWPAGPDEVSYIPHFPRITTPPSASLVRKGGACRSFSTLQTVRRLPRSAFPRFPDGGSGRPARRARRRRESFLPADLKEAAEGGIDAAVFAAVQQRVLAAAAGAIASEKPGQKRFIAPIYRNILTKPAV